MKLLIAAVSLGFQNAARYGLIIWVPVHFLGSNWKSGDAGIDPIWITVALPVGMAVGALTNGWVSDRLFGSKRYLAIILYMVLGAITSLWMWTLPTHSSVAIGALFLCGFFVYGPASSFWALCPDLAGAKRAGTATGVMNFALIGAAVPAEKRGTALGISIAGVYIGISFAPVIGGILTYNFGWESIFSITVPFLIIAYILMLAIKDEWNDFTSESLDKLGCGGCW